MDIGAMQTAAIALMSLQLPLIAMPIELWSPTPAELEQLDPARLNALWASASAYGYSLGPQVKNAIYVWHAEYVR